MDRITAEKILESDYDIIVLGSGVAGLAAALSGSEHGAHVLVMEKAPPSQRGGNSRRSGSFRVAYGDIKSLKVLVKDLEGKAIQVPAYTEDDYYQDLARVTNEKTDPDGGVRTDGRSRVISKEGQPIPGLYAAGTTTGGLLYDHYPLGASLMQAAVFGRIAGREAATIREA